MFTQTYVQSTQTASPRNLGEQGVHLMWISLWDWLIFCLLALFPFCADYSLSLRLSLFSLDLVPLHFKPSTAFSLTFTPHHKSISSAFCLNPFFFFSLMKVGQPCCLCPPVFGIYFTLSGYCAHMQSPQLLLYPKGAELLPSQGQLTSYYQHLRYFKLPPPAPLWAQKHFRQVWETLISPPTVANTRCFRETRHPVRKNMPEFAMIRWTKPTTKERWNVSHANKTQNLTLAWNIFQQHQIWKMNRFGRKNFFLMEGIKEKPSRHNLEEKNFVHFFHCWFTTVNPIQIFILS